MWERIGVGSQTRDPNFFASRAERIKRSKGILFRALNTHTIVAFIGSGCSVPLGYPTWHGFARAAVEHSLTVLQTMSSRAEAQAGVQRLTLFADQLQTQSVSPQQLAFILGVCQRTLQSSPNQDSYYKFLDSIFCPHPYPPNVVNPYHALLDLPIRRFVTSNYDEETERALSDKRNIPPDEFTLRGEAGFSKRKHRAFTQQPKHYDQLALFSLSRVDATNDMVFHCHGHYQEPESMVVTESDYQRWYLSEKPEASAFRQTIELLFSSNPVLFVGFSLSDEDLLRTLRLITANRTDPHTRQPLFALLPEVAEGVDEDAHDFLFERYGVNVIPFLSPNIENRGQDLIEAFKQIKKEWHEWWDGFLQKPKMRRVGVTDHPPHPYRHYPIQQRRHQLFGGKRLDNLLLELKGEAQKGQKVIVLTGRGGSGKSWCAQKLTDMLHRGESTFWFLMVSNDSWSRPRTPTAEPGLAPMPKDF